MIDLSIPNFGDLHLKYLVLDFNGTIAVDGVVVDGALGLLDKLSSRIEIHILTADTYGTASSQLGDHAFRLTIIPEESQDQFKSDYVKRLGGTCVACIGNGRNDRLMMREAALSVALIQREGAAAETLGAAHIVSLDIRCALELFLIPKRLIATLRS